MTITARFASVCPNCNNRIAEGATVNWSPGSKATHVACPARTFSIAPVAAPVQRIAVEDAGVYVLPSGDIVRVKANREKTRTYGCRWVATAARATEHGERVHGDFTYEQGLVQQVAREGRKMTLDEAKAFAVRHGFCVRCGRHLVAAQSVEQGMGPVCVQYFGGS